MRQIYNLRADYLKDGKVVTYSEQLTLVQFEEWYGMEEREYSYIELVFVG